MRPESPALKAGYPYNLIWIMPAEGKEEKYF
jgi:hypothetical protein